MTTAKPAASGAVEVLAGPAALRVKPGLRWDDLIAQARRAAPEAFADSGCFLNLIGGSWGAPGNGKQMITPIDGSSIGKLPMIDLPTGLRAVRAAKQEAAPWARTDLAERAARVRATLDEMRTHRDALAGLLMWEIGKPMAAARADVDRCIDGVAWYVEQAGAMAEGRRPLGLVSNIASWNYPLSVLMHAVLVQALVGNSVIAKSPTDGGGTALAVSMAIARRHGLPVSFVSGSGGVLSEALVRNENIDCLSFVGGRSTGRDVAAALVDVKKRYMLEMEGVNAYGVWEFSDWRLLADQLRRSYEYAKQRCTAYPRFVVQRSLFPAFLETYLSVVRSLRVGNPTLVASAADDPPPLDFGPLINAKKVEELRSLWSEALGQGAVPIYQGELDPASFLPHQDTSAYFAPCTLLNVPRSCRLYFSEPFGPLDSLVTVNTLEELVQEMNVSNGCLVATLATDDRALAERIRPEVRSFKFGVNKLRSRGDREELFGGLGQSWKGCFVGGSLLVRALTCGEGDEELPGVFVDGTRLPQGGV